MSLPRFLVQEALPLGEDVNLPLGEDELRHLSVRRIEAGEHIACFTSAGQSWEVKLTSRQDDGATGIALAQLEDTPLPHLTLVQGISKGERMTLSVRQATELGAERIIPLMCQRSIVRIKKGDEASKGERWRKVALSAAKQSGRSLLPQVDDPMSLKDACHQLASYDRVIVCWEEADLDAGGRAANMGSALEGCTIESQVAVVIGPEGGLSADEVQDLKDGCPNTCVITLGPLILRTETASTVAVALALYGLGGLGAQGCDGLAGM